MRGVVGIVVGLIIITLGLAGLGVALAQMMIPPDPSTALLSVGGLALFVVMAVIMMIVASYS